MKITENIFADYAEKYHQQGLPVFPVGKGEDGKLPFVRWNKIAKYGVSAKAIDNYIDKFPDANIAMALGKVSGVIVIDDDGNRSLDELFNLFGYTPLVVQTSTKGYHLYYAYNGEKSCHFKEAKIDLLSDGKYCLSPPSVNRSNKNAYIFINGGFSRDLLDALPALNQEVIKQFKRQKTFETSMIFEGERNNRLFNHLRDFGQKDCAYEDILEEALSFNESYCDPVMRESEIINTCKSIWNYKIRGCLIPVKKHYATSTLIEITSLSPNAHSLLCFLKANHIIRKEDFVICIPAMVKHRTIKMGLPAMKKALNELLYFGILVKTHQGGRGQSDPNRYKFGNADWSKL